MLLHLRVLECVLALTRTHDSLMLRHVHNGLVCWATVCKTVCPMLSDRCLPCLSVCLSACLSVTLVFSGQTVGWIKTKLGMEVGLGPDDIVLDADPLSFSER